MPTERMLENPTNPESPVSVFVVDEPGAGGACHKYVICNKESGETLQEIDFQNGNVLENGVNGITNEALLLILIDRMNGFNNGPFPSKPNSVAKTHCEEALLWLDYRTADRRHRKVEGKEKP